MNSKTRISHRCRSGSARFLLSAWKFETAALVIYGKISLLFGRSTREDWADVRARPIAKLLFVHVMLGLMVVVVGALKAWAGHTSRTKIPTFRLL